MIEILNIQDTTEYKGYELLYGYYDILAKLTDNATNGDVITTLFDCQVSTHDECDVRFGMDVKIYYGVNENDYFILWFPTHWWNAPYKTEAIV